TLLAMTNTMAQTSTDSTGTLATTPLTEIIAAARDLARGGRWDRAVSLLDATSVTGGQAHALLALVAAEAAVDGGYFTGTTAGAERLNTAEKACAATDLDPGRRWDLA